MTRWATALLEHVNRHLKAIDLGRQRVEEVGELGHVGLGHGFRRWWRQQRGVAWRRCGGRTPGS